MTALSLLGSVFSSLYTDGVEKHTTRKELEVAVPPPSLGNGSLKAPEGVHTCKGRNGAELVNAGGTLWPRLFDLSLAPAKTAALQAE